MMLSCHDVSIFSPWREDVYGPADVVAVVENLLQELFSLVFSQRLNRVVGESEKLKFKINHLYLNKY